MFKALSIISLCLTTGMAHADENVRTLLRHADAYRLAYEDAQVDTQVTLTKNGEFQKERRYTIYLRNDQRSLVVMRSAAEKGQKALMVKDDFWLILPTSQRPLHITPMQKLLGDASVGDVATMSWSGDYDGEIVGEEPCDAGGKERCTHLSLHAQRKGLSYPRLELWVAANDTRPIRADLYVASNKLAKQASFTTSIVDGHPLVTDMVLVDRLQIGRETSVKYLARTKKSVPDDWYNPMFLTRNEVVP